MASRDDDDDDDDVAGLLLMMEEEAKGEDQLECSAPAAHLPSAAIPEAVRQIAPVVQASSTPASVDPQRRAVTTRFHVPPPSLTVRLLGLQQTPPDQHFDVTRRCEWDEVGAALSVFLSRDPKHSRPC